MVNTTVAKETNRECNSGCEAPPTPDSTLDQRENGSSVLMTPNSVVSVDQTSFLGSPTSQQYSTTSTDSGCESNDPGLV